MLNIESTEDIQIQINDMQSGYCVLIKLINYDELQAICGFAIAKHIMNDLNKIIRQICREMTTPAYSKIEHNKVLVILPNSDHELIKKFVYKAYTASQLYTNEQIEFAYMNCKIASIDFPGASNNADEIYALLAGLLVHDKDRSCYYKSYDSRLHNLEIIKTSNKKLNKLRKALENNTVVFAYQPIVDRKTGHTHYYECLLRMPDDHNNLVSVGGVIQDAESKGLINIIDQIVLRMAVNELVNASEISLSVNISNIGILDSYLLEIAESLLRQHSDVAPRLIIEITETSINEDYENTKMFIDRLHKFGCRFALDDFGSGFTSFKQLQNLPIDIIKIDGSYIRNVINDRHSQYFVETLVKISEELGIKTVAEFVENGEIAKFLIDIKVDGMQGNFFSPASSKRNL